MAKKVKKQKHENLSESNIQRVISLLNPPTGQAPITKKEACEILNIAYNTTRLSRLLEDYEEQREFVAKRKAANRGRPASKGETNESITMYLQGESISDIAKYLYRSPSFVKAIIDKVGVPNRRTGEEGYRPALLPDNCIAEDFNEGEKVWSAVYDAPAEIGGRLDDKYYIDKYGSPCYKIYVFQKVQESNDTWVSGVETGGFSAYSAAYDIGKLSHLKEYGVDLKRV
jgi:hypothetical protein